MKKIFIRPLFIAVLALFLWLPGTLAQAASVSTGQVIKTSGLATLYYYASNGKRYVFPNEKTFKSWFPDFNEIVTVSALDLASIPLAGNAVYRPGVLLVKITTDPRVYAVSKNGVLRWIMTESIARALYGDSWNLLVDDVPDPFFVNYSVGAAITSASEFDPDAEVTNNDTVEGNFNMPYGNVKHARTGKCHVLAGSLNSVLARNCDLSSVPATTPGIPKISSMAVYSGGDSGRIDVGDEMAITFSEPIDPASVRSGLSKGGSVSGVSYGETGGLNVSSSGRLTLRDIASFDVGSVESSGNFTVRLALNTTGKTLTVTITDGADVIVTDQSFSGASQTGGTVRDTEGLAMGSISDVSLPSGSFGTVVSGTGPSISSMSVSDGGDQGYIDSGDYLTMTFNEAVDPLSINSDLRKGGSVSGVAYDETGGLSVSSSGKVAVRNVASFDMGSVESSGNFTVSLALSSTGKVLTATITGGSDVAIADESFGGASQTGGTVKDVDGNVMGSDSSLDDPAGSFGGTLADSRPDISSMDVSDGGRQGYIDTDDYIMVTFGKAVNPASIDPDLRRGGSIIDVSYSQTGGLSVSSSGVVTVKNIASFDMGSVSAAGNFTVKLSLNSSGTVLVVTVTGGGALTITAESFGSCSQTGGTVEDADGNAMESRSGLGAPTGTFGDSLANSYPRITSMEAADGGNAGYIDIDDSLAITFSEVIDPVSVHASLHKGGTATGVATDQTGGLSVSSSGVLTVRNIASFDLGSVEGAGNFTADLALDSAGRVLTITISSGSALGVTSESFGSATQTGGTVEDVDGNAMDSKSGLSAPAGTFGGDLSGSSPRISSISVSNGGSSGYVDASDYLTITFSKAVDPLSINSDLRKGGSVSGVSYSETGGLAVSSSGKVTIRDIAYFDLGSVSGSANFTSRMSLNSTGKVLTITISSGSDVGITSESFGSAVQTGGTVEDTSGNAMESDSGLNAPTGTFGGSS